jgi:hypothetical protein
VNVSQLANQEPLFDAALRLAHCIHSIRTAGNVLLKAIVLSRSSQLESYKDAKQELR